MLPFIISRLIQSIPLFFGATIVIFVIMRLQPGDPAFIYVGPLAEPETLELVRKQFGLNEPLPVQYLKWVSELFQGNLGDSYLSQLPVSELLLQRIPATIELTIAALTFTIVFGITTGILSALKAGTVVDWVITAITSINIAAPNFWIGILFIYLFGQFLGWLPPGGRPSGFLEDPLTNLQYLLLPTLTLGLSTAAYLSRLVRSSMLEVLHEDYVRTARAKGLHPYRVIKEHVLRNALVPIITIISFQFGRLLGGAIVIESIFSWPGVGRLILFGITGRDYAVVQGTLVALVLVFVVINLFTDLIYGWVDPRIRVGASATR